MAHLPGTRGVSRWGSCDDVEEVGHSMCRQCLYVHMFVCVCVWVNIRVCVHVYVFMCVSECVHALHGWWGGGWNL